jgi:hypothetical protein
MAFSVSDIKTENNTASIATILSNIESLFAIMADTQAKTLTAIQTLSSNIQKNHGEILALLTKITDDLSGPVTGNFSPPQNLIVTKLVEVSMSVLELEVGQTAGPQKMTFDEPTPPADGAVASDNPAVATITLDPTDHQSWTVVALSVGIANMSYTGTSASPDVGPAVVPNMVVTVVAVPVAEHGDFNPTGAPISGP